MELLLEKESDLTMSWHPGCIHMGGNSYTVGALGSTGPGKSSEQPQWKPPIVSKSLQFTIGFKTIDTDSYNKIVSAINELANTDPVKVNVSGIWNTKNKVKTKDSFVELEKEVIAQNEITRKKFEKLCDKIEAMGCYLDDVSPPKYMTLPEDCFEWETKVNFGGISVCCHSETQFYKFLDSNGLLEKYFPEWYRTGNF